MRIIFFVVIIAAATAFVASKTVKTDTASGGCVTTISKSGYTFISSGL